MLVYACQCLFVLVCAYLCLFVLDCAGLCWIVLVLCLFVFMCFSLSFACLLCIFVLVCFFASIWSKDRKRFFDVNVATLWVRIASRFLTKNLATSQISFALTGLSARENHHFYRFRTVFRVHNGIVTLYGSCVRLISPSDLACVRARAHTVCTRVSGYRRLFL